MNQYKKRAAVLLLACGMIWLAACQPTPEEEVVINKNEGSQGSTVGAQDTESQQYSLPKQRTDAIEYHNGKLRVNIDADIYAPKTESFSTYEIVPDKISQSQTEKLVEVLFGNAKLEAVGQQWTKAQYEELLLHYKASYASGNTDITQEEYKANVKDLEEGWANAPETVEQLDPSEQIQAFSDTNRLNLQADLGRGEPARLLIVNSEDGYDSRVSFKNNDGEDYEDFSANDLESKLNISEEEAINQAENLLLALGINDMDVAATGFGMTYGEEGNSVEDEQQCYLIYFTRTVDGVPTTYDIRNGDASDSDEYEKTLAIRTDCCGDR